MVRSTCALVVDDHPLVARGIAQYLVTHCGFATADLAADAAECLRRVSSDDPPALAVIDFWLADGTAPALLREIATRATPTRLLVVSGDDQAGIQTQVRKAGAHGFLCKQEPPEVFAQAVTALLGGGSWFPVADRLTLAPPPARELPVRAADLGLTQRQAQVLALVLRGLPNKRIATELALTEPTVKEHVSNVLARLGVPNRVAAINLLRGRRVEL